MKGLFVLAKQLRSAMTGQGLQIAPTGRQTVCKIVSCTCLLTKSIKMVKLNVALHNRASLECQPFLDLT